MKRHMIVRVAAFAGLGVMLSTPVPAASMRCGSYVVNESETVDGLLTKCGEPQKKEVIEEEVRGKNAAGVWIKMGVQVVEKWRYQKDSRTLPMEVTIVDGRIKKIERLSA